MKFQAAACFAQAFLLMALVLNAASALEPPRPEAWLREESDVVVEGRVLGVTFEEIESRDTVEFRVFRAWLAVESVLEGSFPVGETLEVVFRIRPETPLVGGFTDARYLPGERVRAYLDWGGGGWDTVHWSGKRTLEPSDEELPRAVGQSVMVDDSTAHQPGCEARGGRWAVLWRASRHRKCVLPAKDAERACSDSRQCAGLCLAEDERAPEGEPAAGRCSDRAPLGGGCRNIVVNGLAEGPLCAD